MAGDTGERIAALTRGMLRKKLYVIVSKATAAPDRIMELLPDHLEYMIALEKRGLVFASGPLTEAGGAPRGDGMTVLRCASADEAHAIAEADPFVVNGLRVFEVREWIVMEGSLALKVNFSDQSIEVA
jgi:uncharacterized protein